MERGKAWCPSADLGDDLHLDSKWKKKALASDTGQNRTIADKQSFKKEGCDFQPRWRHR